MSASTVSKQKILARLRRAEGQLAAVRRMVEEDAYCMDIIHQLSAVRGALHRSSHVLLEGHLEHCVAEAFASGDSSARKAKIDELLEAFGRLER